MTNLKKAQNFGISIAEKWFKDLLNPELQDSSFRLKFPNVVYAVVKDIFMLVVPPENIKELKEEAGKAAYNRALELIKTI